MKIQQNESAPPSPPVLFQALSMAMGTMSSRVLGLVREMALAGLFDRYITDAWTAAFRLPNMFRRLFGEGSLSVSFVPVFVDAKIRSEEEAKNLANAVFTLLLGLLAVLSTLGIVYCRPIFSVILDPVYVTDSDRMDLTVRMGQIMASFVFLICSYAFFMAILNALGKFALAAMAPTLFNLSLIVFTLLPQDWFHQPGDGLAIGVIVGGILQAGLLIPALRAKGFMPRLQSRVFLPGVKTIFLNMLPGLLGLGLSQITTIVNMRFASSLGPGSISYIYWADRLIELPSSLISVSLGTALLPALSSLWVHGEKKEMSATLHHYLRITIFVALPCALVLYFLAPDIVRVLFQRGQFNLQDTNATAQVVQIYGLMLIPLSCVRVILPAYYAVKNTWFPAVVSAICLLLHVFLATWWVEWLGLKGLNLASMASTCLNLSLLLIFYRKYIFPLGMGSLIKNISRFLIPTVGMAIIFQIYSWYISNLLNGFVLNLVGLVIVIALGLSVFLGIGWAMGLDEQKESFGRVYTSLKRKLSIKL